MREQSQGLFKAALSAAGADYRALSEELVANERRNAEIRDELAEHVRAIQSLLSLVRLSDEESTQYRALIATTPSANATPKRERSKHGSVTQAMVALLDRSQDGMTAREIMDEIDRGDFKVISPETAVRSGLKNLRGRGSVEFVQSTGRYRLKKPS